MATFTEVRFAHEDGALADTLRALPDADVKVLPETSTNPEQVVYVLQFDGTDADTVADALERDHTVAAVHSMPEFDRRNLWGVEFARETRLLAPHVTSDRGFVVDAHSADPAHDPRGWHETWLLPDRKAVHDVWEHAREEGFDFEVLNLRRQRGADARHPAREALTDDQRVALLAAFEQGYFAEPREASLGAVAESLGHSPSAVGGRIRRGMKALVGATLVPSGARE